jgi:hypothetical protein
VPGAVDPLDGEQFRDDRQRLVDRDREADPLGAGPHGDVDPDHLPVDVEERPAGVARIDARVGLDEVLVLLGAGHFDVAVQRGDDPAGDRVLVAVGVAEGEHRLADHEVVRGSDRDHR